MLSLALALLFARVFGYLFDKVKQPAVIGEIVAGIVLGGLSLWFFTGQEFILFSYPFHFPHLDFVSTEFEIFAEIGILFLLFMSGLETHLKQMKKMGKTSSLVAAGGILAPLILGILAGSLFGFTMAQSVVIGLILVATSVGVTVRTLLDLNKLDSDVGTSILGAAVIDDVIGVILLAFVMGIESPLWIGLKVVIFFLIFLYLGLKVIDRLFDLGDKIHLPKALLSISLSIFLLFSFFADAFGIAGIIGAFVAGILIGNTLRSRKIIDDVQTISYGFFIPLFFVWVGARLWGGIQLDGVSYTTIVLLTIVIIFVAIIGKIIGCGLGAFFSGMTLQESLQVGVGMVPRMELALIIVSAAISRNILGGPLVEHQLLSVTILLTIVTTILTPFMLKVAFRKHR